MYKIIAVPKGAVLPPDVTTPVITEGDFLERLRAGTEAPVIVPMTVRELECLVTYLDLIPLELRVIIGLRSASYNSVWADISASLTRITIDNLLEEERLAQNAAADAGQQDETTPALRSQRVFAFRAVPHQEGTDDPVADIE